MVSCSINKYTVEPVFRDHLWEAVKVVSQDRWSLMAGNQDAGKILIIIVCIQSKPQY